MGGRPEKRVSALKGIRFEDAKRIAENLEIMPGAKELCSSLKRAGWKMIAVSGGFSIITDRLKGELGLDKVFCNELVFENGLLVGLKINVTSDKAASVLPTIRNWGINKSEIVVVVDGANDLNLFDIAGYTVGFCPVEKVREKSDAVLEIRNLSLLLKLLEKRFGNAVLASTQ